MIPVSKPFIAKNAKKYLLETLKSGWISGAGPLIERFEQNFAGFIGTKYAIAVSSGTTALHLALTALKIGLGDEVIVPAFTMISTILPVIYQAATPILVDVETDTGNINPKLIEEKITSKTKVIMPVHINGHPADVTPIIALAKKYNLFVVEDAAEAHGAQYKMSNGNWKKVGSIGDLGCFSFYANKIVTSGEGGMITTNNKNLADRVRSLRNLARTPKKHFYHQEIAFNYRLSSLQAALGIAQLEEVETILQKKKNIASLYNSYLKDIKTIALPKEKNYARSANWQYGIKIKKGFAFSRNQLAKKMASQGIETRTFFIPLQKQPVFKKLGYFKNERYPVSEDLGKRGLNLPTGPNIKTSEIKYVAKIIGQFT